jgi:3-hydroxyacyl-[acyl-carrier-protein] dehydratase
MDGAAQDGKAEQDLAAAGKRGSVGESRAEAGGETGAGTAGGEAAVAPGTIGQLDILQIMHAIPHRYPMLLLDRMVDVVPDVSAVGIKNVTVNEPFFQGHFPGHPVMPGVLIIEAMAQTAAVLVVQSLGPEAAGRVVYFMTIESAKFRRPVLPGDQLRIHVTRERRRGSVWKFSGVARVDGVSVAEATYSAMIMDHASSEA